MSEREKIVERLEALDLGACEDSNERLSAICNAVSDPAFGWTLGACEGLRERLVHLIGGDGDGCDGRHCEDAGRGVRDAAGRADGDGQPSKIELMAEYHRGFVDGCNLRETATWQLSMERDDVVCRLRKVDADAGGFVKALAEAVGVEWQAPRVKQTIAEVRNRLIHLLGGDVHTSSDTGGTLQDGAKSENKGGESASKMTKIAEIGKLCVDGTSPNDDGTCPNGGPTPSLTDELRKWVTGARPAVVDGCKVSVGPMTTGCTKALLAIADRIDEQFTRICEH